MKIYLAVAVCLLVLDLTRALVLAKAKPKAIKSSRARFDAVVETTGGFSALNSPQITWFQPLTGTGRCSKRGVLKLDFGAPGTPNRKNKVLIDMWFNNPIDWVFNIGNSPTNNGWAGDARSTSRDSEIQGKSKSFAIYANDLKPHPKLLVSRPGIINYRLSVIIANSIVIWNNWGSEFNFHLNANLLFSLNGQPDKEAKKKGKKPNFEIYFGINRVIANARRKGTGLCRTTIRWLN